MNLDTLTSFLGWCSVINIVVMAVAALALTALREPLERLHARQFRLEPAAVRAAYFDYLSRYKIGILIFNLAPWLALKIMQ